MQRHLLTRLSWAILFLQYGLQTALANSHPTARSTGSCPVPSLTAEQFAATKFDYIVIGAGAGGLPVAARLAEDPSVSVGLIEAGVFHPNDPLIEVPGFAGQNVGNASYDWLFATVPQSNAGGRVIQEPRGKMLGGSTGLNLIGWDRASKAEYDAWALLSNSTSSSSLTKWDFEGLLPYFMKVENVDLAHFDTFPGLTKAQYAAAKKGLEAVDGSSGPVQVSYNSVYGDLVGPFVATWNNLHVPTNPDIYTGDSSGARNERYSIGNGQRSYAATAYYCPSATRKNFHVLTSAQATKINFNKAATNQVLKASGVSFVSLNESGNKTFIASAAKEVILSAGAVQSPHLLELSGIGDASILTPLGIHTLVNLPGVGTNLQDHIYVPSQFVAVNNITTFDKLRYNQTFYNEQLAQYNKDHTGFLTGTDSSLTFIPSNASVWPRSEISSLVSELQQVLQDKSLSPLKKAQYQIQLGWIKSSNVAQAEIIAQSSALLNGANNTNYLGILAGLMHPLSRGTIHVTSANPLTPPAIDPQYLSYDYDLQTLRVANQITVALSKQAPISGLLTAQQLPDPSVTDKAGQESFVRTSFATGDHLSGTAPMASRALGGVVDSSLKVYGTSNVRVVDASIIPLIVGTHLQSTVYAIGEKAADIIKRGA